MDFLFRIETVTPDLFAMFNILIQHISALNIIKLVIVL